MDDLGVFPLFLVQHPYDEHQDDMKIDILINIDISLGWDVGMT